MNKDSSKTPLAQKLGIHDKLSIYLENPPEDYFDLVELPHLTSPRNPQQETQFIHVFVKRHQNLKSILPKLKTYMAQDGMIWISWPKKESDIESDLDENVIRELGLLNGLVDVKVCSINYDWSGLKFVFKAVEPAPI
jgi:hypothetical protein